MEVTEEPANQAPSPAAGQAPSALGECWESKASEHRHVIHNLSHNYFCETRKIPTTLIPGICVRFQLMDRLLKSILFKLKASSDGV